MHTKIIRHMGDKITKLKPRETAYHRDLGIF
jgi:hypothetical protein